MTSSDAAFEQLITDARQWASQDPDPATATALVELTELAERR